MSVKIYVGNISFETSQQDLRDLFAQVGSVEACSIIEDRLTNRSRGFGFVTMSSKAEAENAVAQLDGLEFNGRSLKVSPAGSKQSAIHEDHTAVRKDHVAGAMMRAYFKQPGDAFAW